MQKGLDKLETIVLATTLVLFPLAIFPLSPNPFVVSKLVVLVLGVTLALAIRSVRMIVAGKFEFHRSPFDIPALIIAISYIVGTWFATPNKMEALLLPGTATVGVASIVLYFLITQKSRPTKVLLGTILSITGAVYGIITILGAAGLSKSLPALSFLIPPQNATPDGGYLPSVVFLVTILLFSVGLFLAEKNIIKKAVAIGSGVVVLSALVLCIYNILPGRDTAPRFPDYGTSWSIAVDTLKANPILGAGPGNYLTAFNRLRPLTYNNTELWAVRYATASNHYLTIITENGLLGLVALAILFFVVFRVAKQEMKDGEKYKERKFEAFSAYSVLLLFLLFFFFPTTVVLTAMVFVFLAFATPTSRSAIAFSSEDGEVKGSRLPAILITAPIFVLIALVSYNGFQIVRAEYTFREALQALGRNDANTTYREIRSAIQQNPRVDRYRATNAQINILLANAVARKAQDGQQLSEEDRKTVSDLIQQAIAEGKAAIALNPLRAGNWEVLARIYQTIIPIAKGSDQFAIQTYQQAIALDPYNPNLRIALGSIYYAAKDYETASRVFEQAVAAKPDHANALFNYAYALYQNQKVDQAIQVMSRVVSLAKEGTQDKSVASKALEDFKAKKSGETAQSGGEELNPPQPEEPGIDPKVDLPEGSEPPATPTPTPGQSTVTPTVTPTPTAGVTNTVTPILSPTVTPSTQ